MSTCRFAQRVSTIKNDARINEDVDPGVLIRKLRSDCAALNDEVAFLKVRRRLQHLTFLSSRRNEMAKRQSSSGITVPLINAAALHPSRHGCFASLLLSWSRAQFQPGGEWRWRGTHFRGSR